MYVLRGHFLGHYDCVSSTGANNCLGASPQALPLPCERQPWSPRCRTSIHRRSAPFNNGRRDRNRPHCGCTRRPAIPWLLIARKGRRSFLRSSLDGVIGPARRPRPCRELNDWDSFALFSRPARASPPMARDVRRARESDDFHRGLSRPPSPAGHQLPEHFGGSRDRPARSEPETAARRAAGETEADVLSVGTR